MTTTPSAVDTITVASARFFRVLGDRTRLTRLERRLEGPRTVSELGEATGVAQSRVSNHLACLRWCRFVEAEQEGRQVTYSISDARVGRLLGKAREVVRANEDHLASCERIGPDWI